MTDKREVLQAVLYAHREDALTCYDHDGYCCVCGEHDVIGYFTHLADVLAAREAAGRAEGDLRGKVAALAEEWRYKGEFGWGPWQQGEGPDPEGEILDDAARKLRALLGATADSTQGGE